MKVILSTTWARRFQPVMIFLAPADELMFAPDSESCSSQGGITWAGTWPDNTTELSFGNLLFDQSHW